MLTLIALAIVIIALVAIRASARLVAIIIAIVAVIVGLVAIKATARTIAIIITITTLVVLSTANAHAAPGIGACGECTSNIIGLSVDYLVALVLAVICVVSTVLVIRSDKKNK